MTAKEYLNKIREIDNEINDKQAELDDLREMSTTLKSFQMGERVQSSPEPDKIGHTIAKIMDKQNEINDMIDRYIDQKDEARKYIDQMEDLNERKVLRRRYLKGMKWEDICVDMSFSWRQIHYIHSKALNSFEDCTKMHRSAHYKCDMM